jgi:hypothetical protein
VRPRIRIVDVVYSNLDRVIDVILRCAVAGGRATTYFRR